MKKMEYLNVGCGSKFHSAWYNVDMVSKHPDVLSVNLMNGIPFEENRFDVVYHSQVLEHIPRSKAAAFVSECFRVLKPGGVHRIVVPDLENIVREYLRLLESNLSAPTEKAAADYDWIMLELYDQVVRDHTGGDMAAFLQRPNVINESYVTDRIGKVAMDIVNEYAQRSRGNAQRTSIFDKLRRATPAKVWGRLVGELQQKFASPAFKVGRFRLGGEVHLWMYDRYSLQRMLASAGFAEIALVSPYQSAIPSWAS